MACQQGTPVTPWRSYLNPRCSVASFLNIPASVLELPHHVSAEAAVLSCCLVCVEHVACVKYCAVAACVARAACVVVVWLRHTFCPTV